MLFRLQKKEIQKAVAYWLNSQVLLQSDLITPDRVYVSSNIKVDADTERPSNVKPKTPKNRNKEK